MQNNAAINNVNTITKWFFYIALVIGFLVIVSCDSPVGFTEAQPSNASDLSTLPGAYQGMYICESDNTLVKVEGKVIYSEYTEVALIPMSYITEREECTIVNDTLYIEGQKECVKVTYPKEGFIAAAKVTRDTIFRITPFQKARMYKGNLILSQVTENELWTIAILELDEYAGIRYRAIIDDSDLTALSNITNLTKVAIKNANHPYYKVSPKEVELDQLFKDESIFIDCDYFSRVHMTQ